MKRPLLLSGMPPPCALVIILFLLLCACAERATAASGGATPSAAAETLFEKAVAKYPFEALSSRSTNKQARAAYTEAAKAGHPDALFIAIQGALLGEDYAQAYQLLSIMDAPTEQGMRFRPEAIKKVYTHLQFSTSDECAAHLNILLRDAYLLGRGTKQDYAKARSANARAAALGRTEGVLADDIMADPLTKKAQEAFIKKYHGQVGWENLALSSYTAGSVRFAERVRASLGKKNKAEQLAFYLQYADVNPDAAAQASLLILAQDKVTPEELAKIRAWMERAAQEDALAWGGRTAKDFLANLPRDLNDFEGIKKLAVFLRENGQEIGNWTTAPLLQEVYAGILDTPLKPGYVVQTTAEDKKFIEAYDKAKNKEAFLLGPGRKFKPSEHGVLHAYMDLRGDELRPIKNKDLRIFFDLILEDYPPYAVYWADCLDAMDGPEFTKEDFRTIARRLKKAATKGYPPAMYAYARFLGPGCEGMGFKPDIYQYAELLIQAVRMGHPGGYGGPLIDLMIMTAGDKAEQKKLGEVLYRYAKAKGNNEAIQRLRDVSAIPPE